jgi:hypothetical protein
MFNDTNNEINKDYAKRLASFKKLSNDLIATNNKAFQSKWGISNNGKALKNYSSKEIENIINSGSLEAQL